MQKVSFIFIMLAGIAYAVHQAHQRHVWRKRWAECLVQARLILDGVKAQYPHCAGVQGALTVATSTDGTLYQASSAYRNLPFEDMLDLLDRVDPQATPVFTMAKRGKELGETTFWKQVDSWQAPKGAQGFSDGWPVQPGELRDNTVNRRRVGNQGQAFRESYGAGWIADQVPDLPGTGKGINKRGAADALTYLKQDMEAAFTSFDQSATADTAVLDPGNVPQGSTMAGIRKLVDQANGYANPNAAVVGGPSDIQFAPAGACVAEGTALQDGLNLDWVESALLALRQATNKERTYLWLQGLGLKRAISGLIKPGAIIAPDANAVSGQVTMFTQEMKDTRLGRTIDVIYTDYGTLMCKPVDIIGDTTTDPNGNAEATRSLRVVYNRPNYGLILDTEFLELRFGVNFQKGKLPDDGGTRREYIRTYAGLLCTNPTYFGFQAWS